MAVVSGSEYQLRRPIVPRADIRDARLASYEFLSGAEVTELEAMVSRVNEKVLRLYISMSDTKGVDVGEGTAHLVSIELNEEGRDVLLLFVVVLHHSIDCLRDIVHDHVKIKLILLK